jgi:predicted dehydrogenase
MSGLRTWRFGVAGTGAMAATMMECLALEPRVEVAAVASADAARARDFAARFGIPAAHGGIDDLLARTDIDAVYIATATRDHAAHSIAALAAGKAVLCEKPFATSADEGRLVVEAAQRSGRLFMEAQWTPALPAYRELLRLVRERSVGEPVLLRSEFGFALDPASHPRLFEGAGAGVLLDFGVYPIVLALQAMGPVTAVRAALRRNASGVDVHASLQLEHAGGGHSQLAASLVATLPNRTSLGCTRGTVELDSPVMGAESLGVRATSPMHAPGFSAASGGARQRVVAALRRQRWLRRLRSKSAGRGASEQSFGANRYSPQLTHFIGLLDAGALDSDLMPHATSLDVLRIIDAARGAQDTDIAG